MNGHVDLHNNIKVSRAISPVDLANDTAAVSEIIDRQGYAGLEFVIATGSLADAGATFTVLVEDGAASNLSDAAAVDDSLLLGTEALASFTQATDDGTKKIGYIGNKRYVRLTITPSGNASAALACVIAIQHMARVTPIS